MTETAWYEAFGSADLGCEIIEYNYFFTNGNKGETVSMNKKVLAGIGAGLAALIITAGVVVLVVKTINYNPAPTTDVWDDDDDDETESSSAYRDNPDPTPKPTRETQGRDYYENGGYNGMDSYYIIQDLTTEEIIAEYEYYHDIAHTYDINDLKYFDKELKHPCYTYEDVSGLGLYMFYDLIMPDEKVDHIQCFNVEGDESTGGIEFTMKIRIHDGDKAMEIYNAFVDKYSVGAQGYEYYNMLNTYDTGVWITVDDWESRIVCYKKMRDDNGEYYWLIYVAEEYREHII